MTKFRAVYPGGTSSLAHMQSTAATSLTTATITNLAGFTHLVTSPFYFTYSSGISTMLQSGLYDVNASATFASNLTGRRMVMLYVNGSEARRVDVGSGGQCTPLLVHTLRLTIGDTVEVRVFQSSGGALLLTGTHDFQMKCVGA